MSRQAEHETEVRGTKYEESEEVKKEEGGVFAFHEDFSVNTEITTFNFVIACLRYVNHLILVCGSAALIILFSAFIRMPEYKVSVRPIYGGRILWSKQNVNIRVFSQIYNAKYIKLKTKRTQVLEHHTHAYSKVVNYKIHQIADSSGNLLDSLKCRMLNYWLNEKKNRNPQARDIDDHFEYIGYPARMLEKNSSVLWYFEDEEVLRTYIYTEGILFVIEALNVKSTDNPFYNENMKIVVHMKDTFEYSKDFILPSEMIKQLSLKK